MNLTPEERAFLRHLIAEHREYYGILASNPKCSAENELRFAFINHLWVKLGDPNQWPVNDLSASKKYE